MGDPLERLRSLPADDASPDLGAIRARARRIRRRRQAVVGSAGVAALAAVAVAAVVVLPAGPAREVVAPAVSPAPLVEDYSAEDSVTAEALTADDAGSPAAAAPRTRSQATIGSGGRDGALAGGSGSAAVADVQTPLRVELLATEGPARRSVRFVVRVCNPGDRPVEASFSDGQRFDVEVRKGEEVVWRWSDGQMFSQATGSESWAPGQCRGEGAWEATWDGTGSDGRPRTGSFQATGVLSSDPERRSEPQTVCILTC